MRMADISETKNTMANRINNDLMPQLNKLNFKETKEAFLEIVDNPKLSIANETREKYHKIIEKQKTLMQIQMYICNIGLKSAGLGTFS